MGMSWLWWQYNHRTCVLRYVRQTLIGCTIKEKKWSKKRRKKWTKTSKYAKDAHFKQSSRSWFKCSRRKAYRLMFVSASGTMRQHAPDGPVQVNVSNDQAWAGQTGKNHVWGIFFIISLDGQSRTMEDRPTSTKTWPQCICTHRMI